MIYLLEIRRKTITSNQFFSIIKKNLEFLFRFIGNLIETVIASLLAIISTTTSRRWAVWELDSPILNKKVFFIFKLYI